jgi:hypothetical protein
MSNYRNEHIQIIDIAINLDKIYMICLHNELYYISINNLVDLDLEEFYIIGYTDKDSKSSLHKPISIAINPVNGDVAVAEHEKGIIKIFSGKNYKFIQNLGGIQRAPEPNSNNSNGEDSEVSTYTRECVVGLCRFVRGFVGYKFNNPISIIYSNDGQYLYILDINGVHTYNFKDSKYYLIYKYEPHKYLFSLNKLCINNNNLLIGVFDKKTKKYNKIKYILFEKIPTKSRIIEFDIEPCTDFIADNSNQYDFVINTIVNNNSNCILTTYHFNLNNSIINIEIKASKTLENETDISNYKIVFYETIYYYGQFTNELFKITGHTCDVDRASCTGNTIKINKYFQYKIPSKITRKIYRNTFTNKQKTKLQQIDSLYSKYNNILQTLNKKIQKFITYLTKNNKHNHIKDYNFNVNDVLNINLENNIYKDNYRKLVLRFHPDKLKQFITQNIKNNNNIGEFTSIMTDINELNKLYLEIKPKQKQKNHKSLNTSHNVSHNKNTKSVVRTPEIKNK